MIKVCYKCKKLFFKKKSACSCGTVGFFHWKVVYSNYFKLLKAYIRQLWH